MFLSEEYTQIQVEDIFDDVYREFVDYEDEFGFDKYAVSHILSWLNANNRKTLGRCNYRNGKYFIYLNPNILKFSEDGEKIIRETLAHELCHTLPGCMNHGKEFHAKARLIKDKLGYYIDTKADVDSSNYFRKYLPQANYMVKCDNCGNELQIARMSQPIKNPSDYNCTKCGGTISSYILNRDTGEYELYKSSTDAPDYKYMAKCTNCDYETHWATRSAQFKRLEDGLIKGYTLKCPRCGKETIYMIDDGKEIHAEDYNKDWRIGGDY